MFKDYDRHHLGPTDTKTQKTMNNHDYSQICPKKKKLSTHFIYLFIYIYIRVQTHNTAFQYFTGQMVVL